MAWIETSWEAFDECPKCAAKKGKPCRDLRNPAFTVSMPHKGRKQIGPAPRTPY